MAVVIGACSTPAAKREAAASKADPLVDLGVAYMERGDRARALDKLTRALQMDPNLPRGHYAIALLYDGMGEEDKAQSHYRRALSLDPRYAEARNAYGAFLCRQGDIKEAEKEFLEAARNPLYTTPDLAYTNAGLCLMAKQDKEGAEKYFREALQLNPLQPTALLQMAELSYQSDKYLNARAYLQRYREVAQHTPESLWLGILSEMKLGDRNAASSLALLLRARFPDSDQARLLQEMEQGGQGL